MIAVHARRVLELVDGHVTTAVCIEIIPPAVEVAAWAVDMAARVDRLRDEIGDGRLPDLERLVRVYQAARAVVETARSRAAEVVSACGTTASIND
jgi:hypothetical protein